MQPQSHNNTNNIDPMFNNIPTTTMSTNTNTNRIHADTVNDGNTRTRESNINSAKARRGVCALCDRPRTRRDLCNRCRQKVESRARKLSQDKAIEDISVVQHVMTFINNHITQEMYQNLSQQEYNQLINRIYPFLVCVCQKFNLQYSSKMNTY